MYIARAFHNSVVGKVIPRWPLWPIPETNYLKTSKEMATIRSIKIYCINCERKIRSHVYSERMNSVFVIRVYEN